MEEDNWKSTGAAAGAWLQSALTHRDLITVSDDGKWEAVLNEFGILTLWHKPSNTVSVVICGIDGLLEPSTFHFLGHRKERPEAREPVPGESHWELQHRRMMGVKDGY